MKEVKHRNHIKTPFMENTYQFLCTVALMQQYHLDEAVSIITLKQL